MHSYVAAYRHERVALANHVRIHARGNIEARDENADSAPFGAVSSREGMPARREKFDNRDARSREGCESARGKLATRWERLTRNSRWITVTRYVRRRMEQCSARSRASSAGKIRRRRHTARARARERCALRKREARRLRAFAKRLFLSEERSPEKRAATGREGGGREGGGGTASENGVNREYRDRVASRPAEWLSRHYAYAPVALSAR